MSTDKNGIIGAGNWIIDWTKSIDTYPAQDTLANILSQESNNGGAAYNVLKDLSRLGAPFPLYGIGLTGEDEAGQSILDDCHIHKIDTSGLQVVKSAYTSYTDVMLVKETGRRTFFHYRGANALLDIDHFRFDKYDAKILHLGYLLLLDRLDEFLDANMTRAATVLKMAKENGLITSVDLVSESSDRFSKLIAPSLPYVDYLFLNEYEAGKLTGIDLTQVHLDGEASRKALTRIFELGVREWVILHFPEGVRAMNRKGSLISQGSVKMPPGKFIGATGAGDAFAAGVLYGLHEGWDMPRNLELGVGAAASSLTHASCSEGVMVLDECLSLADAYGYRTLPG